MPYVLYFGKKAWTLKGVDMKRLTDIQRKKLDYIGHVIRGEKYPILQTIEQEKAQERDL